ncbi:MAG: hypothetical protein ACI4MN_04085 [Candidatus Coproplasma sp.]
MTNKTYYSQPKKGVGKIVAATACALALTVGVSAIGVGTSGFKDWSFSRWFPKDEVVQTTPDANENGGASITEGESSGMSLAATAIPLASYEEYGVSALAENAYSLNVTYTPEDTTFQETTYTIAFKNPSSSWATGKTVTDYATIEQSAVGSKDAVLTVLKPFSEQIIVTATNNRNTSIKATTTVDYVCTQLRITAEDAYCDVRDDIFFSYRGWSEGTLTPETYQTITFVYDVGEFFVSQAAASGFTVNRYFTYVLENPADLDIDCCATSIYTIYHEIADYYNMTAEDKKAYDLFLGRRLANNEDGAGVGVYGFSYNRVYNGVTYSTYDITQDSSADWMDYDRGTNFAEAFEIVATSASSNIPSIIVG